MRIGTLVKPSNGVGVVIRHNIVSTPKTIKNTVPMLK